jgi:hypothetical protein
MKIIIIVLFAFIGLFAQDNYTTDSLAVRAILDSNGLTNVDVEDVTTARGGRIVTLSIVNRRLTVIPPEIGNLTALEELTLRNNSLTSLPDEIGNLTNLTFICVGSNDITGLPESFGNLTGLETLHLNNNELTTLPDSMVNLTNLTDLRLQYNKIDANVLPEDVKSWADANDSDWQDTQDPPQPIIGRGNQNIMNRPWLTAFPNPFYTATTLTLHLPELSTISLRIFDVSGKVMSVLVDNERLAGTHRVEFNGLNLPPCVYHCMLDVNGFRLTKKVILLQ